MNNKFSFIVSIALLLGLLCSCSAKKQYSNIIECAYITNELQDQVLNEQAYALYSAEDVAFMLDDVEDFDSYSVIYSTSSDDISEIGIFHAVSEEKSLELLDDLTDYLSDLKEEKGAFVRNYLPDEQQKLDGAKVRRFGNYVVFTVLPETQSNAVFEKIDKILK